MNKLIIFFFLLCFNIFGQNKSDIQLIGTYWDNETGFDINCEIRGFSNGKKILDNKKSNKIDLKLYSNLDSLVFESIGYPHLKIPTYFHGKFEKKSVSFISLKTEKMGKYAGIYNFISYGRPSNFSDSNSYILDHYYDQAFHCSQNITKFISSENGLTAEIKEKFKSSRYILKVKSKTEFLLQTVEFLPKNGLNFVDLNVYQEEIDLRKTISHKKLDIFFNQGEYLLLNESENLLKNLLKTLKLNEDSKIIIKGFSDGIGNISLNITLSKYRAQTISNYLISNGISKENIIISWQNFIELEKLQKSSIKLKDYRKAELQIDL